MAENNSIRPTRASLIDEIKRRVEDKILEPQNAELLIKLIKNADSDSDAMAIAQMGTIYNRTGLHFDHRLEKTTDTIHYFKKNDTLSFTDGSDKPHHKLIVGDNYHALQNLLIQYRGMVDVIYIDPPYGKDSLGECADTNYENAITRDNLLSMLYPRLLLAKELLCKEGMIFCSIDDKNHAYVKCLFDEIFLEKNFEGQIHWRRRHNQPNDKTKLIGIVAEHILAYSKDKESHKQFGLGKVGLTGKFTNPDNDPRGPWLTKPWKAAKGRGGTKYELVSPTGVVYNETWYGTKKVFEQYEKDNRVRWSKKGNGIPRIKVYEFEAKEEGQCASNWWPNKEFGCNQDATDELKSIFYGVCPLDNPKPTTLIKALLQLGTIKDNAIILDFYAGSATTGQAAMELNNNGLNYQFILCQIDETTDSTPNGIVKDVTSKRLKRVMSGSCYDGRNDFTWLQDHESLGGSLDVYDIASVSDKENGEGKSAFDVIDETLYGKEKFENVEDKIEWVCENFEKTQRSVESNASWKKRQEER